MQAPNLRLLGGWYIDQQLTSYRQGWRGAEAHADIQGMWMRSIASQVTADEQPARSNCRLSCASRLNSCAFRLRRGCAIPSLGIANREQHQ